MSAIYIEHDPFCQEWLRNLIARGLICPGDVVGDINDVRPFDLDGYAQVHAFAGIGVWSLALRNAGWPDDRPVWTGSCPCQPFSAAGQGGGFADERHLWPAFFHLIEQCRPAIVLGEQVASKDGLAWLDLVQADMEGTGYAFGAVDTCAAGFGAPHIRQRLWWCADANKARWPHSEGQPTAQTVAVVGRSSGVVCGDQTQSLRWPAKPDDSWIVDGDSAIGRATSAIGNAINLAQATGFVEATIESIGDFVT